MMVAFYDWNVSMNNTATVYSVALLLLENPVTEIVHAAECEQIHTHTGKVIEVIGKHIR